MFKRTTLSNQRSQDKLVRVTYGSVYDVIVDLRLFSKTLANGSELNCLQKIKNSFLYQRVCAQIFSFIRICEFQYKTSDYYNPKHERVLLWNCPRINIKWPIKDPELNQRDSNGLPLEKCEIFK